LTGAGVDAEGAVALADALKGNTSVTSIHLHENEIDDKGALALADALIKRKRDGDEIQSPS